MERIQRQDFPIAPRKRKLRSNLRFSLYRNGQPILSTFAENGQSSILITKDKWKWEENAKRDEEHNHICEILSFALSISRLRVIRKYIHDRIGIIDPPIIHYRTADKDKLHSTTNKYIDKNFRIFRIKKCFCLYPKRPNNAREFINFIITIRSLSESIAEFYQSG